VSCDRGSFAAPGAVIVDASVWISRFLVQEIHHARSRGWLETRLAAGEPVLAPTLLLVEIAGALSRRTGDPVLAQRVVGDIVLLPESRFINLTSPLAVRAARLASELRLRGADAVYVAVAEALSLPLVTWDREQLTRAAGRIAVRTP
jgi:predicted nucleic acid-binding protein